MTHPAPASTDTVTEIDRARQQCRDMEARLQQAWVRVDDLHQALTHTEAKADRYRHQLDLANLGRARLAEELSQLRTDLAQHAALGGVPVCRACGCHDLMACRDGCAWASDGEQTAIGLDPRLGPLCTRCLGWQAEIVAQDPPRRSRWRRYFGM
ncbi:hypothetical protein KIF24_01970 [Micromonospora sp. Llam7]|uniref:hypothetical protein n=1 Tax=Micromonospora tarapacensis TaxID=2835305 RepID=UPI001C83C23E|nr:hypothetical protein [Micromonospora tarapacensis]MBX7264941.1 hypothetical protein [Micromonospora tarapacensis]